MGEGGDLDRAHELTQSPKCWENTVQSDSLSHLSARSCGLGDQAEKKSSPGQSVRYFEFKENKFILSFSCNMHIS